MSEEVIRIRTKKTCPACQGRGKSYGPRYCRRCRGKTTVRETTTIEVSERDEGISNEKIQAIVEQLSEGLNEEMKKQIRRAVWEGPP